MATLGACPAATAQEVKAEPMEQDKYQPTWESLSDYECPDWYRDAKFGIWAHWGPQCEPEAGDWYARNMYYPGQWQHEVHLQKYGDPKDFASRMSSASGKPSGGSPTRSSASTRAWEPSSS